LFPGRRGGRVDRGRIFEFTHIAHSHISTLLARRRSKKPPSLFSHWQYFYRSATDSEADGLFFGVTCGMGFAALETMG